MRVSLLRDGAGQLGDPDMAHRSAAEMQKITGGMQLPPGMKLPF
jgi:hypothetical protein